MKCNAVFEGGGVKGIGLVGALSAIENVGYTFNKVVGTSAGAIVAALISVGYSSSEIKNILKELDYSKFKDKSFIDTLGNPGKLLSTFIDFGIYEGVYFEKWLESLLNAKGKTKFEDIKLSDGTYKFQAVASDVTDKRLVILPNDISQFGLSPDKFSISKAVRMSMSIPIFFEPYKLVDINKKTHYLVDGGLLSNYPIWLLDSNKTLDKIPTFGFKLVDGTTNNSTEISKNRINNIFDYMRSLIETMVEAHDKLYICRSSGDFERTIKIETSIKINGTIKQIYSTDFNINSEEAMLLYQNGVSAGESFIKSWCFNKWKIKYKNIMS